MTDRKLIEEWLPIAELGIESDRERGASSALPPIYYIHTWWARRPLVMSRAAILASIIPAGADRKKFIHTLGIHGDPVSCRRKIDRANKEKKKLGSNPYGYKRAFTYCPSREDHAWIRDVVDKDLNSIQVLDPTAGGGSISLESNRLGCTSIANDINPVASLLLSATVDWPSQFGTALIDEFRDLGHRFIASAMPKYTDIFSTPRDILIEGYLWTRTIPCPYCSGIVPLSPNWRIAPNGIGVQLKPQLSDGPGSKERICFFSIVTSARDQSKGTISRGDALCPYSDCNRAISGHEIKTAARSGNMDEQLYAVVYKRRVMVRTKTGNPRQKWIKEYREPTSKDYDDMLIQTKLKERSKEWDICDIIPTEKFPLGTDNRPIEYGMPFWCDMFSPRQLLCHGISVEIFQKLFKKDQKNGDLTDRRKAAYAYLAIALDTTITYNSRLNTWDGTTGRGIRNTFARHDFAFSWSYAEMIPLISGLGYEWSLNKTLDSLKGIVTLSGSTQNTTLVKIAKHRPVITCTSGDKLNHLEDGSVDVVVMDPPYYDNVMYAELSDFFYVWLKRTAGLVFPELFRRNLTDKENEAVANPAKFEGTKSARTLAGRDYEERMGLIFEECRRVLKPSGIMTVMFMHKSTGAWNALAKGIIKAGFYITTSWPINSEARSSLHIRDKAAAKSTILLACRPRQDDSGVSYWEDVELNVRESVRNKIDRFERAGMRGIDIYLSAFGPALEEFSRNWPMKRRSPRRDTSEGLYSVTPEDALMTARREVKQWRLDRLIRSTPNKDLDPVTAFFVLAWDTFRAPKFPYDEALHLARALDVDLERDVVGKFAKKDGEYLLLLDSQSRKSKIHLTRAGSQSMISLLHHAAYLGRHSGAEAAIKYIESEQLDSDESFVAALEAMLEVLPPSSGYTTTDIDEGLKSASSDFDSLFNISRLKFRDKIDEPNQLKLM